MEELLKQISQNTAQIVQNTSPKESHEIIVSSNKTNFRTKFNPPLELDKNKHYEMALVNLETYYSFANITSRNNSFRYSPDGGATWYRCKLSEGTYELQDINDEIQRCMISNGHWDADNEEYFVSVEANLSTLRAILDISNGYQVDFGVRNSLGSVLGFENRVYDRYTEGENIVNILSINSILVNVDCIQGSYVNGTHSPTIYSFFPNVSPGYKIVQNPKNLIYLPVTLSTISSLEVTLTDQNEKMLNLRGETVTIRFHIKSV